MNKKEILEKLLNYPYQSGKIKVPTIEVNATTMKDIQKWGEITKQELSIENTKPKEENPPNGNHLFTK